MSRTSFFPVSHLDIMVDIMIIDEDPYVGQAIYTMLKDLSYKIQVFHNAQEVQEACEGKTISMPRMVLLDSEMWPHCIEFILPIVESKDSIIMMALNYLTHSNLKKFNNDNIQKIIGKPLHQEDLRNLVIHTMKDFNFSKKAS